MKAMARNMVLVTASRALDGAVRFLTVPVVLAYFGQRDFGLIALAFAMQGFLGMADFGMTVNAVKKLSAYLHNGQYAEVVGLAKAASFFYALVGLFNLVALVVVGNFGREWFELDVRHGQQFFWMMLTLGVSSAIGWAFSIYRQILHAASVVGWDEAINLTASVLTVLAIWATLHWHLSPASYFALVLIPPLVPIALRVRRVTTMIPGFHIGFTRDWPRFRPLVGTSLWLFALMAAELVANNYRPVILSQRSGLESVAEFRIIQQIAGFALLLLGGSMSVIYPTIARLDAANDHARLYAAMVNGSRLLLWAHLGLLVTLAFLGQLLLQLYVGASFVHSAIPLAIWIVTLVAYHNSIVTSIVLARGKLGFLASSAVFNSVLTLLMAYYLVPHWGVLGAVCSYALYIGIQLLVMYLVAAPAAEMGSGLKLAGQVFARPVSVAVVSAACAIWVVHLCGVGWWTGAITFALLFTLGALTIGRVTTDWAALKPRQDPEALSNDSIRSYPQAQGTPRGVLSAPIPSHPRK